MYLFVPLVVLLVTWSNGRYRCVAQIVTLANDVPKMVQETDALIDDLPGLDKTEVYAARCEVRKRG